MTVEIEEDPSPAPVEPALPAPVGHRGLLERLEGGLTPFMRLCKAHELRARAK